MLNAGIFAAATAIASLDDEAWRKTMSVNLDANLMLLRECHPLLRLAPRGGRVAVIGSKNVPAPGPGAAAYSASKAALTQIARVAALEWVLTTSVSTRCIRMRYSIPAFGQKRCCARAPRTTG